MTGRHGPAYAQRVQLRPERPEDRKDVSRLLAEAFEDRGRVADLVEDLRGLVTATVGLSYVADDGEVVGHVMLIPAILDAARRLVPVEVLSPLAVRPDRQGQGIGSALVRRGLEHATERNVPLVFLEGDPGYYRRLGFVPARALGFRKPSLRIPDAAFQVVQLRAHEPWMTGTLVYPDAFWRHDAVGLREPET